MKKDKKLTFKELIANNKTKFSLGVLLASAVISKLTQEVILVYFDDRVINPDLFFKLTPYIAWLETIADIVIIVEIILFLKYIAFKYRKKIPYYLTSIGVIYIVRALINVMTPLGNPLGERGHGIVKDFYYQPGMFPSGHTAFTFLLYLMIDRIDNPRLKKIFAILFVIEIITMLFSRGHYSIDVVGGMMVAYITFNEIGKRKNKLVI